MTETCKITIEIPKEEHKYLKMLCAKLDTNIKDFVAKTILKEMEEIEDQWLSEKAEKIMEDIKSGKVKTIPLEEMQERISNEI